MKALIRKLRWFMGRRYKEAELREELQFHLAEEERQGRERGLSSEAARLAARRALGNLAIVQGDTRAAWGWARLEQFGRDIHLGLRQVYRNPLFSVISIATLMLGIGGITAIFSAVDGVLLRPLPFTEAERLVMIWLDMQNENRAGFMPTPAEWQEWRRHNTVFTDIALTQSADATLSGDSEPEQVPARKATWNLWSVLGVKPLIGRSFTQEEDEKGVRVAVISFGLWQRQYGGSADILGRKITVNDEPYAVIGVMPRGFSFMPSRDIDIWMPASFPAWMLKNYTWHDAQVVGRLKPGVSLKRASEAMAALSLQVTAKDFRGPHSVLLRPLRDEMTGDTRTALVVLLCASAALLLIACANLANLLLARGRTRNREIAVRSALGAGRSRLVAQFLSESLVLAGLGAVAGVAIALPAMRFLEMLVPETFGAVHLTLDWRVLVFAAATTLGATIAFGLGPAFRESQLSMHHGLREGGRGSRGARSHWFQHSLITIETALAVALLTSGGMLLQTLHHLRNTDLGIQGDRLLTFETPLYRFKEFDARVGFVNAELEKIRAIPGVIHAGAISRLPLTVKDQATFYRLADQSAIVVADQVALTRVVTRDYFETIGARLREGRFFDLSDRRSASPVAVVNETFADRHFPGRSALGERFKFGELDDQGYWYTIAGVVKEIRDTGVTGERRPTIYRLHDQADQSGDRPSGVVVRTAVEPTSIVSAVRSAVWSVDKSQPIWRIRTLEDIVDQELSTPAQSTTLLGAFAVLALLLASIGLYGVLSYSVSQRTSEIGIRMALGATSAGILLSFGKRGLVLTLSGLVIGLALSALALRLMTALMYDFRPDYPTTAAAVSVILLAVAAFACLVPARRASRVDPVVALRSE